MNSEQAQVALDNKIPVVDTYTGELGIVENLKTDGGAMVLYLGQRLARLTQIADLDTADQHRVSVLERYLKPKGAEGK